MADLYNIPKFGTPEYQFWIKELTPFDVRFLWNRQRAMFVHDDKELKSRINAAIWPSKSYPQWINHEPVSQQDLFEIVTKLIKHGELVINSANMDLPPTFWLLSKHEMQRGKLEWTEEAVPTMRNFYSNGVPYGPAFGKPVEIPKETGSVPLRDKPVAWIGFKVNSAATGEPIPNVQLSVTAPNTDAPKIVKTGINGTVDVLQLESGQCTVTSNAKGQYLKNVLNIGGNAENNNSGIQKPLGTGPFYLAKVQEYKVKTGDSLKSIAESIGLTFRELAQFNWNTAVPAEINKRLRDEVGCRKKTMDGKNYMFDDADDPGIILLPNPWEIQGLTHKVHTLSVQRIAPLGEDWVNFEARYDDKAWKTPLAGAPIKVWVNETLVDECKLLDFDDLGLTPGQAPKTKEEIDKWKLLGTYNLEKCKKGNVRIELQTETGEEQAIANLRDGIAASLDGSYRQLVDGMVEYQALWDEYGIYSLKIANDKGFKEAAVEWGKEFVDPKYWEELGTSISEVFWKTTDAAYNAYEEVKDTAQDAYDNRHVVTERAWWEAKFEEAKNEVVETAETIQKQANDAEQFIKRSTKQALAIYKYKDAILALPEQIANGEVDAVESFIDNELREIDPKLADEIKYGAQWQGTMELINDGESISLAIVYLELFISAVPLTFYAHASGKAGFYILIEVVLLVIGALLGGAGAVARIGALAARFSKLAVSAGSVGRKIRNAKKAIKAFAATLENFADVAEDLDKLRKKLVKSRRRHAKKGKTNKSLKERRETEKRKGKCRVCGSKKHSTPAPRRGKLKYV